MAEFKVFSAKMLKEMLKSISNISPEAFIAFFEDEVCISVSNEATELDALLKITDYGFLDGYNFSRSATIKVDGLKFFHSICSARDDDQVHVRLTEEIPVSVLEVHIYAKRTEHCLFPLDREKRFDKLEASEESSDDLVCEVTEYECEASVGVDLFKEAILCSARIKQPLTVTITNKALSLGSGGLIIEIPAKEEDEYPTEFRNLPLHHELDLSVHCHATTFSLVTDLQKTVSTNLKLIFSTFASVCPPPSLEFRMSESSKICYYFPPHSSKNLVLLKLNSAARVLRLMLHSISTISNEAVFKFFPKQVVVSAENSETDINAELKINHGFFHEVHCAKVLAITVDSKKLARILSTFKDDDRVCIFVKDDNPLTLGFHIRDSKKKKNVSEQVEASEIKTKTKSLVIDDSLYVYEIGIYPQYFGDIVAHSANSKQPITVLVTSKSVTLISGREGVTLSDEKDSEQCELNVPRGTNLQLQLGLSRHAEAILSACRITDIVKLRDTQAIAPSDQPLLLEFPIGPFCKLVLQLTFRFYA